MITICPNCGSELDRLDPYRTPPPKKPEPKKEAPKKPRWYTKMDWHRFFNNLWNYTVNIFCSLAMIAAVSFGGYCLYKWITSPSKVDYCYVNDSANTANSWVLKGHVEWGVDRNFGSFNETYLAQKYAQKINCPLDITPPEEAEIATPSATAPIQPAPSASVPELLP